MNRRRCVVRPLSRLRRASAWRRPCSLTSPTLRLLLPRPWTGSAAGRLRNLREIHVHYNQLTSLPDSIGSLVGLVTLELNNNQLTNK